jgi:hypothetical protein
MIERLRPLLHGWMFLLTIPIAVLLWSPILPKPAKSSVECQGFKVSSRRIVHPQESVYFSVVVSPCFKTEQEAMDYANRDRKSVV